MEAIRLVTVEHLRRPYSHFSDQSDELCEGELNCLDLGTNRLKKTSLKYTRRSVLGDEGQPLNSFARFCIVEVHQKTTRQPLEIRCGKRKMQPTLVSTAVIEHSVQV